MKYIASRLPRLTGELLVVAGVLLLAWEYASWLRSL